MEPVVIASNASTTTTTTTMSSNQQINGASPNNMLNGGNKLVNNIINSTNVNHCKVDLPAAAEGVNAAASNKNNKITCKTEWVRLNIGGKYFVTTKTTLCKDPQSFFFKLCQDDPSIGLTTDKVGKHETVYIFEIIFVL